jgi:hypothetical protein
LAIVWYIIVIREGGRERVRKREHVCVGGEWGVGGREVCKMAYFSKNFVCIGYADNLEHRLFRDTFNSIPGLPSSPCIYSDVVVVVVVVVVVFVVVVVVVVFQEPWELRLFSARSVRVFCLWFLLLRGILI